MTDTPLTAGPPAAEFTPVADFMRGVDFDNDAEYGALVADMPGEFIELAKALFVSRGIAANAGKMLWPDLSHETRKKRASRGANDAGVKALLSYFKELAENDGDKPITADELRRKTRAMLRSCKDAKTFESLMDRVIAMDGIKLKAEASSAPTELEEALQFADFVLAGVPGQAHLTTATVQ